MRSEPDDTLKIFIEEQKRENDVTVFDLRTDKDYAGLLDLMEKGGKVIPW